MKEQRTLVTLLSLCSCLTLSLSAPPDARAPAQGAGGEGANAKLLDEQDKKHAVTDDKHPPNPPKDDLFLLFQIDKEIRSFTIEDLNEILSYEDDTLPYALAEKLGQNAYIRVIKNNLNKVKGYLETEKKKKRSSSHHMLRVVGVVVLIGLVIVAIYICIQHRRKVSKQVDI